MMTNQLGNIDLSITPVGYGTWAIRGFGWGEQDDKRSHRRDRRKVTGPRDGTTFLSQPQYQLL